MMWLSLLLQLHFTVTTTVNTANEKAKFITIFSSHKTSPHTSLQCIRFCLRNASIKDYFDRGDSDMGSLEEKNEMGEKKKIK